MGHPAGLTCQFQSRTKSKAGGQECPPHTGNGKIKGKSDGQECPSYLFFRARFGRDQAGQAVVDD